MLHVRLSLKFLFYPFILDMPLDIRKPCEPSPCGLNAICRENNGVGSCTCLPDYLGDPYQECRPECTQNSDCLTRMACVDLKCRDPCPGTCGVNAQCQSVNHLPICICIPGYTGNPFTLCSPIIEICKIYFHVRYFIYCILKFGFLIVAIIMAYTKCLYNRIMLETFKFIENLTGKKLIIYYYCYKQSIIIVINVSNFILFFYLNYFKYSLLNILST